MTYRAQKSPVFLWYNKSLNTMKICLYFEAERIISGSGIGRALQHQKIALESAGISYTLDPNDDYDLLHINTVGPLSITTIAQARLRKKPIVFHAHSTEEDFRNSFVFSNQVAPLFKKHLVTMYSQANAIITPTPYAKKLLQNYGITLPINCVSNGVNINRYTNDTDKIEAFRRYFSLEKEAKVVIGVGLYLKRKGLHDFLDVAAHFPEITFIWFGHTPSISIPNDLKIKIRDHSPNVILPGYVKGPIIEGAFMSSDLFFFPSYEETEGIVVLEALAAKCPVIVRDIGVYEEWLVSGENCYKASDNEGFIELINSFYNHQLKDTKVNGYSLALDRTLDKIGQQLKAIYTRVLEDSV